MCYLPLSLLVFIYLMFYLLIVIVTWITFSLLLTWIQPAFFGPDLNWGTTLGMTILTIVVLLVVYWLLTALIKLQTACL